MTSSQSLPVEAYTSRAWFDREISEIFSRTWQFAGLVEDVAGVGDFITVQAGLYNLIVVRGQDDRLRAFHNLCRHRGTQLLRTAGRSKKVITCPYHDWSYSLDGDLIAVPKQAEEFPDLDRCTLGLHKAAVATWRGMIFAHPDPDAGRFEEWLGDLPRFLGPHRPEDLVETPEGRSRHTIRANWKIVAENFMDVYHIAHLHSATLDMYDHERQVSGFVGPHFHFNEPLSRRYRTHLNKAAPFPLIDHVPPQDLGACVPLLFPNLGLSETECFWSTFHIRPQAPDRTEVEIRTKIMPSSTWKLYTQAFSSDSYFSKKTTKYGEDDPDDPLESGDFMQEDIYVCEQQQRSLASPLFSIGASARTLEASIRTFHETLSKLHAEASSRRASSLP